MIAGSRSFAAIGQWAADAGPEVLTVLGAARGAAEESTFRRAFALVSPDMLDRVLGAWLWTRAVQAGGRLVIAIDGKTVRGARNKDGKAPHLVAALAHGIGAVLGQAAVDEKSNEIPAVRDLLKAFASLASAVITIWSPGIFVDISIMLLLVPDCQIAARNPLGLSCRADVVSGRDCNIARCSRTRRS